MLYLCTRFVAQMAESVDALVSNTSGETRAGSTPALGTRQFVFCDGLSGCSAVGSALRSGRRGRAFESPHPDTRRQRSIFLCRSFFVSIFLEKPCTPVQISLHLLKLPVSPTQSPRLPGSFSQFSRHSFLKGLAPCEVSVFSGPAVPFFLLLLKGHGSLCAERFVAFPFFRKILLISQLSFR